LEALAFRSYPFWRKLAVALMLTFTAWSAMALGIDLRSRENRVVAVIVFPGPVDPHRQGGLWPL
jgi:hypothetical protein